MKLFLLHFLLCAGAFSSIALCFDEDGSFHIEFFPCSITGGTDGISGNSLPMKIDEPSGVSPSDPCGTCVNRYIFTCAEEEDCENLTVPNNRDNLSDLPPVISYKPSVLFPYISVEQTYYGLQAPNEANAALDSLQTVVLLN